MLPVLTELVVVLPGLRVGEDVVRLVDLLELLFRAPVARVYIRVVLACQAPIGVFHVLQSGAAVDAEHGIEVGHHVSSGRWYLDHIG